MAFDFAGPEMTVVPTGAQINAAVLQVGVQTIGTTDLALSRVAEDTGDPPVVWEEGDADAAGDEFLGATSSVPSATWDDRESGSAPWLAAGGDTLGPVLATLPAAGLVFGTNSFSSAALTDAVADMVATGRDEDGFLISADGVVESDSGTRMYSRVFGGSLAPRLQITHTSSEVSGSGNDGIDTQVRPFIGEGEDFRWVYDLDGDDIYTTEIDGVCTAETVFVDALPYTYSYAGEPGYVGVDCCLWQIDSPETGLVGVGQALFFHNLDPTNPSHMPPDSDGDGIVDTCDNCMMVANGPAMGTCLSGASAGATCQSNLECSDGDCSLSQEDADFDGVGTACPEPGLTLGLMLGVLGVVGASQRRRD